MELLTSTYGVKGKGEGGSTAKKVVGGVGLGALHHDDGEKYGSAKWAGIGCGGGTDAIRKAFVLAAVRLKWPTLYGPPSIRLQENLSLSRLP